MCRWRPFAKSFGRKKSAATHSTGRPACLALTAGRQYLRCSISLSSRSSPIQRCCTICRTCSRLCSARNATPHIVCSLGCSYFVCADIDICFLAQLEDWWLGSVRLDFEARTTECSAVFACMVLGEMNTCLFITVGLGCGPGHTD